jgi:hypothetical protein
LPPLLLSHRSTPRHRCLTAARDHRKAPLGSPPPLPLAPAAAFVAPNPASPGSTARKTPTRDAHEPSDKARASPLECPFGFAARSANAATPAPRLPLARPSAAPPGSAPTHPSATPVVRLLGPPGVAVLARTFSITPFASSSAEPTTHQLNPRKAVNAETPKGNAAARQTILATGGHFEYLRG